MTPRLLESEVEDARLARIRGASVRELAARYGVTDDAIYAVCGQVPNFRRDYLITVVPQALNEARRVRAEAAAVQLALVLGEVRKPKDRVIAAQRVGLLMRRAERLESGLLQ